MQEKRGNNNNSPKRTQPDIVFDIRIIGNDGVGKSTLVLHGCDQTPGDGRPQTKVNLDGTKTTSLPPRKQNLSIDGKLIVSNIRDSSQHAEPTPIEWKYTKAVIIVASANSPESFHKIPAHRKYVEHWFKDANISLVVTHADDENRKVTKEQANQFAARNGIPIFEVDLQPHSVDPRAKEMFEKVAAQTLSIQLQKEPLKKEPLEKENQQKLHNEHPADIVNKETKNIKDKIRQKKAAEETKENNLPPERDKNTNKVKGFSFREMLKNKQNNKGHSGLSTSH
jgi:GTPase SAR1 family protein